MKCQIYIPKRHYSKAGLCSRRDVKVVRWAPTPLKTKVLVLCSIHRTQLENGKIKP